MGVGEMKIDNEQMKEGQQVSGLVNAEVKILHKEHEIHLKLTPTSPESEKFVKNFLSQFAETMATQLSAFFNIKGEIVDVGKE
jgi:hypothetical protein